MNTIGSLPLSKDSIGLLSNFYAARLVHLTPVGGNLLGMAGPKSALSSLSGWLGVLDFRFRV